MYYIRVEAFLESNPPAANVYPARKFRVAAQVSNITGAGAEVIHISGNLNNIGDFIDGTFNIQTKVFTPTVTP